MRAVVFKGVGKVAVEDRPKPELIHPDDAILKVKVSALCGSDLHWYRGHLTIPTGFIPGHEFIGVVEQKGSQVGTVDIGDVVVASFSTQCGKCFYCLKKQTSRCSKSFLFGNSVGATSIDGGQAEYVRVPQADSTLVKAPPQIPEHLLVLMGDIFPTGYFCATRFLKHMSKEEAKSSVIAVVGCGPVGICAIATALTMSDTVYALDLVPERLAEAEKLGAKPLLLTEDPIATVKKATEGRGADIALEVVGTADALQWCLDMVRPFGQVSSVGLQTQTLSLDGPALYGKNVTIAWGRCPVRGIFEDALSCLVEVQDMVSFLCEYTVSLEDAVQAYEMFSQRKVQKVLLKPELD
ncbi:S-(hydroxymethyl)glutathione dehydrogenase [Fusarium oxysporum f. sp. cubense race 1]|uniref:S-(Hydroxymethyl)glutathione dehydrogenase n=1 Tax=Fusarium oxysporum f. sp. cubense (strain race 1) TaxID=1229664 RepID=N4UGP4_FUSC1|nr:S-(hydroxymethyl)glutathione dehydrogenase [Fusarium oxysporum f. sp. cubense race 1]